MNPTGKPENTVTAALKANPDVSTADVKGASLIISALNLVRMNLAMYPPGHVRIEESLDHAHEIINNRVTDPGEIKIGLVGNTLMIGDQPLDQKNVAIRDYAHCLKQLRIVYFSLHKDLKKEEIAAFNHILSIKPSDIWAAGTTEQALIRAGVSAITVKTLEVSDFHLTEEKKIEGGEAKKPERDADFWLDLIRRTSSSPDDSAPGARRGALSETLRILNAEREKWPAAVADYENIVKDYFFEIHSGSQISVQKFDDLSKINRLIQDLNPELKNQLLDIAGRQLALQSEDKLSLDHLIVFSLEMLEDITALMKTGERRISQTLLMLMQKMQNAEQDIDIIGLDTDQPPSSTTDIKNLLKEEKNRYVPDDYDQILKESTAHAAAPAIMDGEIFPLGEHIRSIADDAVNLRIFLMLLAVMNEEISEGDYAAYSTRMSRLVPNLIQTGQFAALGEAIAMLHRHAREKPALPVRQMAVQALKVYGEAENIHLIKTAIISGAADMDVIKTFLKTSGPQNMHWLFDLYLDKSSHPALPVVAILQAFGREALNEAVKMLPDGDPRRVVRLLALIRAFNDRYALTAVKNLFNHPNLAVRSGLTETLLHFNDMTAYDLLRQGLKSPDPEETLQSIHLICSYRVMALMEEVMALLKTSYIRRKDMATCEGIVREISATGNIDMIPYLERIAEDRVTLTPRRHYRIKAILYQTLDRYPLADVRFLLKKGRRSASKQIRAVCEKLLSEGL